MQAPIHENWCEIIDTYSKYVRNDYLAAKYDVYKVIKVAHPAFNSIEMLHELGSSGRKVASFICHQGSYIRQGYQFIYDRTDYALPTPPGFEMELV